MSTYVEGPRFSAYTPDNHQAPLYIVTALTLTYAGLFLITRVAVKFKVLGLDDLFLGVAHVGGLSSDIQRISLTALYRCSVWANGR